MSREEKTRVEVAVDVLDTEALYAGAVVGDQRGRRELPERDRRRHQWYLLAFGADHV